MIALETTLERVANPHVRFGTGVAWLAATAAVVRRDRVGKAETRILHVVNDLPDGLFPPAWVVTQLGNVGAAPAAAVAALAVGDLSGHAAAVMAMGIAALPRLRVARLASRC